MLKFTKEEIEAVRKDSGVGLLEARRLLRKDKRAEMLAELRTMNETPRNDAQDALIIGRLIDIVEDMNS